MFDRIRNSLSKAFKTRDAREKTGGGKTYVDYDIILKHDPDFVPTRSKDGHMLEQSSAFAEKLCDWGYKTGVLHETGGDIHSVGYRPLHTLIEGAAPPDHRVHATIRCTPQVLEAIKKDFAAEILRTEQSHMAPGPLLYRR